MIELGNGDRFILDFGSDCMRNIIAMHEAPQLIINDVFQTCMAIPSEPLIWQA